MTEKSPKPWTRQRITQYVSSLLALILIGSMFFIHIPYVMETPGPTVNTLGKQGGKDLISIPGKTTNHTVDGQLRLVTVSLWGQNKDLTIPQAIWGWFNPHANVIPFEAVFPPNSTASQRNEQQAAEMTSSQVGATVAALQELGYTITMKVATDPTTFIDTHQKTEKSPAAGVLEKNDVIKSVNGVAVKNYLVLKAELDKQKPGHVVALGISRGGTQLTKDVTLANDGSGNALLGISVGFDLPVTVDFDINDIGGPSAGMMFALGIIDKLGPTDLAGGNIIAGTGTMDATGNVGAIGGIALKMIGAKRDGAKYFLAPASNCNDVVGNVPSGLDVIKVNTLDDAVKALAAIRNGQEKTLPTCTKS